MLRRLLGEGAGRARGVEGRGEGEGRELVGRRGVPGAVGVVLRLRLLLLLPAAHCAA